MKKQFYIAAFLFLGFMLTGGVFENGNIHNHQSEHQFDFSTIIVPLGITTLICLIATLTIGLLMPKNRKILFPWHKRMAFMTLILALMHGVMVLIFHQIIPKEQKLQPTPNKSIHRAFPLPRSGKKQVISVLSKVSQISKRGSKIEDDPKGC